MSADLTDVKRLLDAFENSDWESVHLRVGDLDVAISVHPDGVAAASPPAAAPPAAASVPAAAAPAATPSPPSATASSPAAPSPAAPSPTAPSPTAPSAAASSAAAPSAAASSAAASSAAASSAAAPSAAPAPPAAAPAGNGTPILAPSPGIFWRSPAPGEPPFVDVGHEVDTDTTVCIVELMKLMNNVHAGVTGVVTAILVGNGESVTMGQPIMTVLGTPADMMDAQ